MLPSKLKPLKPRKTSKGKSKAKASSNKPSVAKRTHHPTIEEVPDKDIPQALQPQHSTSSNSAGSSSASQKKVNSSDSSFNSILI